MDYRAAAKCSAAMIVLGAFPGVSGAQEIPDSSLSDLFSVADQEAEWLAGPGFEGLPPLVLPSPGHGKAPADEDPNTGAVIAWTTIGTLAGDLTGLYLYGGCYIEWCESDADVLLNFVGAGVAVVGGAAGGAILGGGNPLKSIIGSVGGVLGGLVLGGLVLGEVAGDEYGLVAFFVMHAGVTAVAALN